MALRIRGEAKGIFAWDEKIKMFRCWWFENSGSFQSATCNFINDNTLACVRYTARQGEDFSLDVSEWYYFENDLIREIYAFYHIGEIREERKLND